MTNDNKDNMIYRLLIFIYLVMVVGFTVGMLYLLTQYQPPPQPRLCGVEEISPDITQQEREKCRQMRGHKL